MLMTRIIFTQTGHPRSQTTDPADDEIDFHARARCFIKFLDNIFVNDGIQLGNNARRFPRAGVIAFAFNELDQSIAEIEGCDHQFFKPG